MLAIDDSMSHSTDRIDHEINTVDPVHECTSGAYAMTMAATKTVERRSCEQVFF